MERFFKCAILAVVLVLLFNAAGQGIMLAAEKQTVKCVVEWEKSPVSDTQMPPVTVAQLRAEYEKVAAAGAGLKSWEARCRVTSWFGDRAAETCSTLLVSNGKQWLDERRLGDWQDAKTEYRMLGDGECVRYLSPTGDPKILRIQTWSEFAAEQRAPIKVPELPIGYPPFLLHYRENTIPIAVSFPDVRKILADPGTKLLPWRTRVGGHVCYVVERTRITQTPVFHSREEMEAWYEQNPKGSVIVNRDAAAKDMRIDEFTDRVALDPQSGFLAAHWASGHEYLIPAFRVKSTGREVPGGEVAQFPVDEMTCTHFRRFGSQGYVAGGFKYARYSIDRQGKPTTKARHEVVLEDFQVDRQYPSDLFRFDPPKGYHLLDSIRGIQYSVGDSEGKIVVLMAAAQAKKAFYEALKKKPAPPLEGALWLNIEPIRLGNARGKQVQLHFWGMSCGPCLQQLPQLERVWGNSSIRGNRDNYVFISIHPYVDGEGLQQLKDLLRDKQITFPVMVDSPAPDGKAWGKTSAYYRVYSEPSDVWIDEKGHVARLSSERDWVSESDCWMGTMDDRRPTNQIEKSP